MGASTALPASFAAIVVLLSIVCSAVLVGRARRDARQRRDPLTGLWTHERLLADLRASQGKRAALLYLDVDRFEIVNETFGRPAGDRLLATVAGLLRATVGHGLLVRSGGDEFAVLIPGAWQEEAVAVGERLRRAIGDVRLSEHGRALDVVVSIGVAPLDGLITPEEALRRANAACRAAKALGRNRVEVYRPALSEEALHLADAQWSVRLKDALRDDRLMLLFQPIVGVGDNRLTHYEALVRIDSDDGIPIEAGAFIPTAERCGLIREIDRYVIATALARMASESAQGKQMRCAINLSGLSLHEESTLGYITEQIRASGIDPHRITFEITETAAMANLAQARRSIDALRGIGCRFALDDFGKGLSSLAYLRYLPVDYLKIDGAFVRNLATDSVNQAMVRSMNELAHALGIYTIAECVEDQASLEALESIGVDFAQGWHIGHPSDLVATIVLPELRVARARIEPAAQIRIPAHPPHEMLEFLGFLDQLDEQARSLRDRGLVPPDAVTRPDEYDAVVFELVGLMRSQVEEAIARGAPTVEIRLPVTSDLISLAEWAEPRMALLTEMTRLGTIKGPWAAALRTMVEIFEVVVKEIRHKQSA